ncbi:class I SAM-dependent methyltransferase [Maricaulis sp.]|uniref:class I SAM-dependent methyltransferase n=1 Tax=Maricaulis sp. TaxID=1486257 RepID=UPI002B26F77B|nr:class I SAM-dependent methyltransferase [Maricaulis sp.]
MMPGMSKQAKTGRDANAWARFWDDEGSAAHVVKTEADAAALRDAWQAFLEPALARRQSCRLLDIACGNAVVATHALEVATSCGVAITPVCHDYSASALSAAREQTPALNGLLAASDAASLPFADRSLDVVVSQYGVEYAGPAAFEEAARVLRSGGLFQAIVHKVDGVIYKRCEADAALLATTLSSGLFRSFLTLLKLLHKSGGAQQVPRSVQAAERRFRQSFSQCAEALKGSEPGAAHDHVSRLLADISRVIGNWRAYALSDMTNWGDGQRLAIDGFSRRMTSMTKAALDETAIETIAAAFREAGLKEVSFRQFEPAQHTLPAGWIINGRR